MFCPQCATGNPDQAKFCRSCGTHLETVALALAGQLVVPGKPADNASKEQRTGEPWSEKWGKGVHQTVTGAVLLGLALLTLLGFSLVIFFNNWDPNVLTAWVVTCGWMAAWGVISLVKGLPDMILSRTMLRQMERAGGAQAAASTTPLLPVANELRMPHVSSTAFDRVSPPSVTEHTTVSLNTPRDPDSEVMVAEQQKEPQ